MAAEVMVERVAGTVVEMVKDGAPAHSAGVETDDFVNRSLPLNE